MITKYSLFPSVPSDLTGTIADNRHYRGTSTANRKTVRHRKTTNGHGSRVYCTVRPADSPPKNLVASIRHRHGNTDTVKYFRTLNEVRHTPELVRLDVFDKLLLIIDIFDGLMGTSSNQPEQTIPQLDRIYKHFLGRLETS